MMTAESRYHFRFYQTLSTKMHYNPCLRHSIECDLLAETVELKSVIYFADHSNFKHINGSLIWKVCVAITKLCTFKALSHCCQAKNELLTALCLT